MKGTEFWKHNYPDIVGVQVDEDGNIIEKVDLGALLEAYHQAKLKLLGIASVVGRSEQLFCHHEGKYTIKSDGNCCKCHLPPEPKAK